MSDRQRNIFRPSLMAAFRSKKQEEKRKKKGRGLPNPFRGEMSEVVFSQPYEPSAPKHQNRALAQFARKRGGEGRRGTGG